MRFHRTLVAGVLALGVAACGDDVEIVEPTPPPPPPPPALSASMAPASAEVEVGSSVVFAVNVSGGVAGEAASWSCASSNTGIATASTTSAGCQATGVAAGGVTITATVSKGNETANVGSQLTVTAPAAPPPFAASIAPESQSVAVGSSVVFAVNTSGGYTGMMMGDMMMEASWSCSSSDPAIATVEDTAAGCQATGVSGGEVTVNVAATDGHDTINLVAQLTVTTDPVDPVQPFSASMAPESARVAVGSDAVFAINTSGGAADATAEWTCSSSDDAVATAATTDAGCRATGVAAGGVTINAAVTKGEDSANLAAQLTVTAPDVAEPAFVFITEPTDGTSLTGTVSVTVSVERGDHTPEGLSLLVNGEVAAHQSFGMAATPAMDEPAEQAPLNFTLSFNSAKYDRETGAVDYPNGDHTISAELEVAVDMPDGTHGHETVSSNNVSVKFNNANKYNLALATDGNRAMDSDGLMWNSGAVTATVVPVIYTGETISQVTLGLRAAADGSVVRTSRDDGDDTLDRDEQVASITDDEAPFEVMWANEDASSTDQKRVGGIQPGTIVVHLVGSAYSDGTAGPTATPMGDDATDDKPYFMRLDNKGPSVSDINRAMQFNRHYDITNWVGTGHAFTFSSSSTTPDFSDGDGVGRDRSHHQYYAGASTSEDDLVEVSAPSDLDETSNNRAYVLGANVRDLLGNETMVWWAGADDEDGLSNSGTNRGTVDRTDDYKFGVDLTAPTQELVDDDGNIDSTGSVIDNVAILVADRRSVEIDYDDPGTGSGFSGSNAPVHTRIRRFAPNLSAEDGCISGQAYWYSRSRTCEILGDPGSNQWRADPAIRGGTTGSYDFAMQEDGYYAVEYAVMDDAGNRASFIQAGGVIDEAAPVGNALVPAARAIGGRSTLSAFASDNLDLDRVEFYLGFGADAYQMGSESVGSPSLPFEQSANPSISIETLPAGVQSAAGAPPVLSAHVVRILDQAGNPTYASAAISATGDAPRDLLTGVPETVNNVNADGDNDGTQTKTITYSAQGVVDDLDGTATPAETLCWDVDGDGDCADGGQARATLTFNITGTDVVTATTGGTAPTEASQIEAEGASNPFERVVFYVQRDESLTGLGTVTTTWAYLGEGRGRAPNIGDVQEDTPGTGDTTVATTFSWRLNVRGSDVAEAAGLTAIPGAALNFRAVGYTDDGTAVTVDTNGTITLSDDS